MDKLAHMTLEVLPPSAPVRPPVLRLREERTRQLQQADAAHFLHPFSSAAPPSNAGSRIVEHAAGVYVWDSQGHRLLDGMAGLWCVHAGYGQRALIDAATVQMETLPYYNAFFECATPPAIELARRLAQTMPGGLSRVFYCNSGSEACDTIVRMVRHHWRLAGQPQRQTIIGRLGGYHGSTVAAVSLGGMAGMHAQAGLAMPGVAHIPAPHWFGWQQVPELRERGIGHEEFGVLAASWLEEKILEIGADRVAAFIGEPVQGAAGVIVPPDSYWPEIERICRKYDVLLVSDEVTCGFGRTGHRFGCERFGFEPDLLAFAKGVTSGYMPLAGVMVGEKVSRVLVDSGQEFLHGFTCSGHPVACAVGAANLDLMHKLGLPEQVRMRLEPALRRRFAELLLHPLVAQAEVCGLMGVLQLAQDKSAHLAFDPAKKTGALCRRLCADAGLIVRNVDDRVIVAPPLVISLSQIDDMVAALRHALDATLAVLR